MTARVPLAHRSNSLRSAISFGEKLFASAEETTLRRGTRIGPGGGRSGPAARDVVRRRARGCHQPLPARRRRQARATDARPAHRAARRRQHREVIVAARGAGDHPPRLALPRRRDGRRDDPPRRAQRAQRLGQLGRHPHRRPAVRPREPASSRGLGAKAIGLQARHLRAARASASCTRRSARRAATTRSSTTFRCSPTRPAR